jgi:hypothetical protein
LPCFLVILIALLGSRYTFPADREKVEEGQYARLRNGSLVAGSEHSWTLWRLPDGRFELEDHFQADANARAIFGLFLAPEMRARESSEFRQALEKGIEPSDLSAVFGLDQQLQSVTMSGIRLDGTKGVGLSCTISSRDIKCAGTSDNARFRIHDQRGLFWWYGIPTLLRPWLESPQESSPNNAPQKITLLSFGVVAKPGNKVEVGKKPEPGVQKSWGDKPSLQSADLTISNLGSDTLVLGDKSFHTQKYRLEVRVAADDPLSLTVWTDARRVVLAVEDASVPGNIIALMQYKNYSNSPQAATPTTVEK